MRKKNAHVSETPATQVLRQHQVAFTEHPYDYVEHGGTAESARQLGLDEHTVVKTLVMQDQDAKPLIVLMHGDCKVSTKSLARQIGAKSVEPCKPEVASRHSGYLGRAGIYELLSVTETFGQLIKAGADLHALRRQSIVDGMTPLRLAGARKIIEGTTSIDEVLKLTAALH